MPDSHLSPEEFIEAQRIAGSLVQLHKAGLLADDEISKAEIIAQAMRLFDATVDCANLPRTA